MPVLGSDSRGKRLGELRLVIDLTIPIGRVVCTKRSGDEAFAAHRPLLEPADADVAARPPGPVFVPVSVQWYSGESPSIFRSSSSTRRSGNPSMNPRAASATASLPIEGVPPLIVRDPSREYCSATRSGSPLHHAAV